MQSNRVETPKGARADAEALWRTLAGLVRSLVDDTVAISGVGVGCGGPMTWPAAEVSPLNIPGWRDFPLRGRLVEMFPGAPVRVHNDAVCVAVGEHWRGAGHIGHVVVDPAGPDCSCGGQGCLEAFASGPRLAQWARDLGWHSATDDSARELAADAARGHEVAARALERAGTALGVAIASAAHLCDLDVVAIGGGLTQAGPLLFDPLETAFRRHARMGFVREVRVVPAELGQQAGLVGAAALVLCGDAYWSA